jgi:signal transduction histidine kinase
MALPTPPGHSSTPADRWPALWVLAASAALLALAWWQQAPGGVRLLVCAAATVLAAVLLPGIRRPRAVAVGAVLALTVGVLIGAADTVTLSSMRRDWPRWSATEREARAEQVSASVQEVAEALRDAVRARATDASFVAEVLEGRTPAIAPPLPADVESAFLVFRGGRLVARAGQLHTPVSATGGSGVVLVDGVFHTSVIARAQSPDGQVEIVAAALLSSAPPADRFTRPLLRTLPGRIDAAHTVIESPDSSRVEPGATVMVVQIGTSRLARVRATTYTEGETRLATEQRARSRTAIALFIALIAMLAVAWRRPSGTLERFASTSLALATVAMSPLPGLSNLSSLFDPSTFFAPMGGPLTSTAAALLLSAALVLAVLLFLLRATRQRPSRRVAILWLLVAAGGGPFLLRDLARGIGLPPSGASVGLWSAWQLALALVGAVILLAGAAAGQVALGKRRGMPAVVAPMLAVIAAMMAPVLIEASGTWPGWYPVPWILAIAAFALTRRGLAQVVAAAVVAGSGAVTLTWGATVRARVALVEHDLERLSAVDENALRLLERFAMSMRDEPLRGTGADVLLRRYAGSELAAAGYPSRIARWLPANSDTAATVLELAPVSDPGGAQATVAALARLSRSIEIRTVTDGPTRLLLAGVPMADSTVLTVAVPPRTALLPADAFAAFTGVAGTRGMVAPYKLELNAPLAGDVLSRHIVWRRRADALHGDGVVGPSAIDTGEMRRVHVEVELRGLDALLPRGALLVLLDVLVVLLVWTATALADGALGRLLRVRRVRWSRSYRVRLSGALLTFFIVPAGLFALWAWVRLQDDDRAARELLVRETLRVAAAEQETRPLGSQPSSTGAPLFLYRQGLLATASDSVLDALAPLGRLLPVTLTETEFTSDDLFATRRMRVGESDALVGYRRFGRGPMPSVSVPFTAAANEAVLVTPARGDEFALDARREDLGVLVLFATMLGALAAVWSSGVAARSLARPVGALREAALALAAGGESPRLGAAPASEFAPVYRAFSRMADDLAASRQALEAAQRRTAAVLQNVASGVVGVMQGETVSLANPRADALLGFPVRDTALASWPAPHAELVLRARAFLAGSADEDAFELKLDGRELRARLTRLPTGAVLTLDDVTELASAQRVLAWGEMARQVAHEIKNPLTPIRLGVQHLRRAYRDGRGDFGEILETNVGRVLQEIDHLDEIARAFSRYGTAPSERTAPVAVDVAAVVHDVVQLERLGDTDPSGAPVRWQANVPDAPCFAVATRDELREVLINLLENARLAGARTVRIEVSVGAGQVQVRVQDDGSGIAEDVLPRIFEPHFSTRTSGSGLGLAISRRLIEGWGGTITVTSRVGEGTAVHVVLPAAREASAAVVR